VSACTFVVVEESCFEPEEHRGEPLLVAVVAAAGVSAEGSSEAEVVAVVAVAIAVASYDTGTLVHELGLEYSGHEPDHVPELEPELEPEPEPGPAFVLVDSVLATVPFEPVVDTVGAQI
jgi:hypothetical protein